MSNAEQKRLYRRKVAKGFPVENKFTDPEQIERYFSEEKIQCLRCGRWYKSLSLHLSKIHGMDSDEYKTIYGLPYYRGLIGSCTREVLKENAKNKYKEGIWEADPERAKAARLQVGSYGDRRQPYRDVLTQENLNKMNEGKSGESAKKRAMQSKWGSKKHIELLRNRPQCSPPSEKFIYFWLGKKQSIDHVFNRTGSLPKHGNRKS